MRIMHEVHLAITKKGCIVLVSSHIHGRNIQSNFIKNYVSIKFTKLLQKLVNSQTKLVYTYTTNTGFMLYFLFYSRTFSQKYVRSLKKLYQKKYPVQNDLFERLQNENATAYYQAKLLCALSGSHVFSDTKQTYFPLGCMTTLPGDYAKQLQKLGIQATPFSRLKGQANNEFNNRSHRKITVIDGKIGYTGGVNIADEYINQRQRFGHWKDVGIRLEGSAVYELTKLFLIDFGLNVIVRIFAPML